MARQTRAVQRAAELLAELGYSEPPVDVDSAATYLGVDVRYEKLDAVSGATVRARSQSRVVINETHSRSRQRFTLAHELGHYLLHVGRQLVVDPDIRVNYRDDVSSLATDSEEIEANSFAASFLMPADALHAALGKLDPQSRQPEEAGVISELASMFGVSKQAMSYRLVNLGIMDVDSLGET